MVFSSDYTYKAEVLRSISGTLVHGSSMTHESDYGYYSGYATGPGSSGPGSSMTHGSEYGSDYSGYSYGSDY